MEVITDFFAKIPALLADNIHVVSIRAKNTQNECIVRNCYALQLSSVRKMNPILLKRLSYAAYLGIMIPFNTFLIIDKQGAYEMRSRSIGFILRTLESCEA